MPQLQGREEKGWASAGGLPRGLWLPQPLAQKQASESMEIQKGSACWGLPRHLAQAGSSHLSEPRCP